MADYEFSQTKLEPADAVQMLAINGTSPGYLTGAELRDFIAGKMPSGVPIGTIVPYGGDSLPNGFLDCNGAAVSRTTYDVLFSIIDTKYGEGDGYSTFNLPNLTGRFLEGGAEPGAYKEAGLPNITGSIGQTVYAQIGGSKGGAFGEGTNIGAGVANGSWASLQNKPFDASLENSIYGNSDTVQPASLVVRYVIKAYDYNADSTPVSEFESQITALTSQVGALQNQRHIVEASEITGAVEGQNSWYRRWSDGWLEQGGLLVATTAGEVRTVTYSLPFKFDNHVLLTCLRFGTSGTLNYFYFVPRDVSKTGFTITLTNVTSNGTSWYACGWEATT